MITSSNIERMISLKHSVLKKSLSIMIAAMCIFNTSAVSIRNYTVNAVEASNAEPIKNEYQILSPVPSGSSISPI